MKWKVRRANRKHRKEGWMHGNRVSVGIEGGWKEGRGNERWKDGWKEGIRAGKMGGWKQKGNDGVRCGRSEKQEQRGMEEPKE